LHHATCIQHREEASVTTGRIRGLVIAVALLLAHAALGAAQEFEPRTYAVAPVGLNFVGFGYGFASGGVFMDPALAAEDVEGDVHLVVARYVRTLSLFGKPSKVKVVVPWSDGHWEGFVQDEFIIRDATGLGDPRIVVETLFHGAEPMKPMESGQVEPATAFGARLQIIAPMGEYDETKAINLGSNRWTVAPEIGFSTPLGKWSLEVAAEAWFFGDNDNFFNGRYLEQDPLLVVKVHAIRTIRPGFWWALAGGYGYGGRTYVNGVARDTIQRNWRVFAMVAYPLTPKQGISLSIGSGGNAGAGTDFDAITVGYQVAWGGG
jgi:hypothetical protein